MDTCEVAEKTRSFGREAMDSIGRFGLSATPQNYTVWYAYHAGEEPGLGATIDVLISSKQPIDDRVCAELYQRYFTSEDQREAVLGVSGRVEETIVHITRTMAEAGDNAAKFGASLQTFTEELDGVPASASLKKSVRVILDETRAAQVRSRMLEDRLKTIAREARDLQQNLEELRRDAMIDAVTKLFNRKQFDRSLREWAGRCMESAAALSMLIFDIDEFRQFNETYGHQTGDQVLRLVGATIKENLKGRDIAARYGGEEFAAILPDTSLLNAEMVGERLRAAIAMRDFVRKNTGESLGKVTMSVGVSEYRPGEPLEELVERADQALYMAKRSGRNCVLTERDLEKPVAVNR